MRQSDQSVPFLMSTFLIFCLIGLVSLQAFASSLPDPTKPPSNYKESKEPKNTSSSPEPVWRVDLILVSKNRKLTLINGQKKRVGDVVSGARVVSIRPEGVTLDYKGKRFTVTILPDIIENKRVTGKLKKDEQLLNVVR